MSDDTPPNLASAAADVGELLPGERGRTASGIPLGRLTSRAGLLTWNGTEVETVHAYPVDSRWLAFANRDKRGGWWLAYHEFARGEHLFRQNAGPYPRVMVDEILERQGSRVPDTDPALPPGLTLPDEPPDQAALDLVALDAVMMRTEEVAREAAADEEKRAEDQADGFGTTPSLDPTRWD